MAIAAGSLHRINRGDKMPKVNIVPPDVSEEECILDFYRVAWEIIQEVNDGTD